MEPTPELVSPGFVTDVRQFSSPLCTVSSSVKWDLGNNS